jgi:hypothetical protein
VLKLQLRMVAWTVLAGFGISATVLDGCSHGLGSHVLPGTTSGPNGGVRRTKTTSEASYPNAVLGDNPVAYYRFDDTTATTMTDSSTNGHNGAYGTSVTLGAPGLIASSGDKAATFPGGTPSSTKVATASGTSPLQPTTVSLEAWFSESAAPTTTEDVATYGTTTGSALSYSIRLTSANLPVAVVTTPSGTIQATGATALSTGTGYDVVATYDGSNVYLYVDGELQNTTATSGAIVYGTTNALSIGGVTGSGRTGFAGTIDEVAVYGSALSTTQVQNHWNAAAAEVTDPYAATIMTDAPKAYYRLDESGPAMYDATTNRLNGAYGSGITKRVAGLVQSEGDPAASFPGGTSSSSTMATVAANSLLQPASTVSIEAVVSETSAATAVTDIVSYGGTTDSTISYSLRLSAANTLEAHFQTSTGTLDVPSTTTLTPGTAYHVVVAFGNTLARIYVGDTIAASVSASGTLVYGGTTGLSIGGAPGSGRTGFKGTIDEVAVYSSILSSTQVVNHFLAGGGFWASEVPKHLQNWKYACQINSNCATSPGQNLNVPASWMGSNVTWAEVSDNDTYVQPSTGETLSAELAGAGVKHVIEYTDPNIAPYCGPFPTSNGQYPTPSPSGTPPAMLLRPGVPEDGTIQCATGLGEEAGQLHTIGGSYAHAFQHQGGTTDGGYRLYVVAFPDDAGTKYEPFNIHDPDVQAGFTALSNMNAAATDVMEDDAGAAYNCVPGYYGYCAAGATYGPATYAPPTCSGVQNAYWCYYFGETAVEWDQFAGSGAQQAYEQDAINLTNASSRPVIANNGGFADSYDIGRAQNAGRLEGIMLEGAWGFFDNIHWINNANAALLYHGMHKYVVELYSDTGNPNSENTIGQLASTWIVFDPTYSIEMIAYRHPSSSGSNLDTTFPEETIFPAQPRVATPSSPNLNAFQSASNANLYIREYAWCDQAGVEIGPCAALVNIGTSAATIPTLSTTYSKVLVQNTTTSWYNGGTPTWSTSVPTSVPAGTGVILLH